MFQIMFLIFALISLGMQAYSIHLWRSWLKNSQVQAPAVDLKDRSLKAVVHLYDQPDRPIVDTRPLADDNRPLPDDSPGYDDTD